MLGAGGWGSGARALLATVDRLLKELVILADFALDGRVRRLTCGKPWLEHRRLFAPRAEIHLAGRDGYNSEVKDATKITLSDGIHHRGTEGTQCHCWLAPMLFGTVFARLKVLWRVGVV